MKDFDLSLYLVTDRKLIKPGKDFFDVIEEALNNGVTLLQLREKEATSREFYRLALKVKEITQKYHVPLIINDRLDIALAVDADGVHLGQDDIHCDVVRSILGPDKILGISAGSIKEAIKAQNDGADYLGIGTVYATSTKKDTGDAIGLKNLKMIKDSVNIPAIGIGGININNARDVVRTGVDGISVVSAIMAADDICSATMALKEIVIKNLK